MTIAPIHAACGLRHLPEHTCPDGREEGPTPTERAETFGMRYSGGPFDGDTMLVEPGTPLHRWPLVDRVDLAGGGHYVKVRESQLPDPIPGVMRGAEYEWRPEATS